MYDMVYDMSLAADQLNYRDSSSTSKASLSKRGCVHFSGNRAFVLSEFRQTVSLSWTNAQECENYKPNVKMLLSSLKISSFDNVGPQFVYM